jgi:PKD repeat protein
MMKKLIPYMFVFLFCLSAVLAANTATLNFYDEDGYDVDYVTVYVFECTDDTCSDLANGYERSDREDYDYTGSSNTAELSVDDQTSETWFVAYIFATATDEYLPYYQMFAFDGSGYDLGELDITLTQKDICRSTIQSFSVTNSVEPYMPIEVNVEAALEADTYSAFSFVDDDVYDWGVDDSQYDEWYIADVDVDLEITMNAFGTDVTVYTDSESLEIMADESENVEFEYTPTSEGEYTATVTTTVTDGQCAEDEEQSSSQDFTVVEEGETEYCYTLVDNLAVYEYDSSVSDFGDDGVAVSTPETGVTYIVAVDKISNEVGADVTDLTPLETDFTVIVTNDDGETDFVLAETVATNADATVEEEYSFEWTPSSEGDNTISVNGVAADCAYATNNDETDTLVIYVDGADIETAGFEPVIDSCSADPTTAYVGEDVVFDVDVSFTTYVYEVLGEISYSWDFTDGSTDTDKEPTHAFSAEGTYDVVVTATHDDGEYDTCTVTVEVIENVDPSLTCDFDGTTGTVDEALDLSVTASDDGTIESYDWDFGDGNIDLTTTESTTNTYTAEGTYTVDVTVTDDYGATNSCSGTVTIEAAGVAPEVDCSVLPTEGTVDEEITLEVDATDSDGTVVAYSWDFGDGNVDLTTTDSTTNTYIAEGTYTITVEVSDDDLNTATCSQDIEITEEVVVDNEEPTVSCDLIPSDAVVGEEFALEVEAEDSDGTIVSYDWDFGDGNAETTTDDSTTYTYGSPAGSYIVEVTVTDDDGATASCSTTVEVQELVANEVPTAVCNGPYEGIVGEDVTFDATGSEDTDGTIVSYDWDFGDSTGQTTTDETVDYAYEEAGEYTVVLTVTDDAGDTATCETTATIEEANEAPELDCSLLPTSAVVDFPVTLEVEATDDVEVVEYVWDFGDGNGHTTTDAETEHTYTAEGTYAIIVHVSDEEGETAFCSQDISVETDIPAVAVASATPTSGEAKLKVQFSSEGSSGNAPLSYKWSFGDGSGTTTTANPKHTYNDEGVYTATLLVTDLDGDTDTDTVIITVGDDLDNNAQDHYYIDGIALSDDGYVNAGDILELYVGTENIAGLDKTEVTFNAIIQELGVYATSGEFDIDDGDSVVAILYLDIPEDTPEGVYYVRVTVSDDDVKRVVYRDIIVSV